MAVTELPNPVSSSAPVDADRDETPPGETPAEPTPAPRSRLPLSLLLTLFLGLALTSLLLLAAAVVSSASASGTVDGEITRVEPLDTPPLNPASSTGEDTPDTEQTAAAQIPALFPSEPSPVPQELITDIEAASGEPLPVELGRLLSAIQEGFGRESVQLAPELRAYVFRMASRFDWNPDTFRVAVTAPDADLAEARATTLRRLFENATGSERLQIRSGAGPHSLTLVSDS
ncbi:MAG: hypothetical protein Rubg2KO_33560 [Rubricoccaceae bacterium]